MILEKAHLSGIEMSEDVS